MIKMEKRLKNLGSNQHKSENFFQEQDFNLERVLPENYMKRFSERHKRQFSEKISKDVLDYCGYQEIFSNITMA